MSLSATTTDFINLAYLLKGNYRKGVHRLREIMGTPEQAQALCTNTGALCLILGHDPTIPDANSEQLRSILLDGRYTDLAVENWLPLVFEDTIENIVGDKTTVAAIIAGSTTAPAIAASDKWLAKCLCTLAEYDSASINSIADMVGSSTAMASIASSTSAITTLFNSEKCLDAAFASDVAYNAIVNSETASDAVLANDAAQENIAGNITVVRKLAASAATGTGYASDIIIGSDVITDAATSDDTARASLMSSDAFCTAYAAKYVNSFSSVPWSTVAAIAEFAAAKPASFSAYQGKKRSIAITGNGTHSFTVAGVGVDAGSGFTFICDDLVGTHAMNSSNTTSGGWESSQMRSWLSSTMLNNFPAEVRNLMNTVGKKNTSGYGAATTQDKLWIPSQTEVGLASGNAEGAKYPIFTDNASRVKKNGGSASYWWLRSVVSSTNFRGVGADGSLGSGGASDAVGVCPCFCI